MNYLIALAGVATLTLIATPFFMTWLADGDILFTKVREGTAKAVMAGDSFHHFVLSHRGYHLNDPRWRGTSHSHLYDDSASPWDVLKNPTGDGSLPPEAYDPRSGTIGWVMRKLGLFWIGLPPFRSVLSYSFSWNEDKVGTTGDSELWHRDEDTDFIYTSIFPYLITIDSAETSDRLPLDGLYQLTIRIVNPFKALFETENWLESVSAYANRQARNYVGENTYADLVSETMKTGGESGAGSFSTSIMALNATLPGQPPENGGTISQNGVTIVSADLQQLEISGDDAGKIREATMRAYTAEQEATATRVAGDAAAHVISVKGEAVAQSYEARLAVLDKHHDLAALMLQTDAMSAEGPGRTVLWANNPFIQHNSAVSEALTSLGIKTPEELRAFLGKKSR